jgi:hypothetical protein
MKPRTVRLTGGMTDEWTAEAHEKFLSEPDAGYDKDKVFAGESADVEKPDGSLLFALRPGALVADAARFAWPALLRAAKPTNNRPGAAGGADEFRSGIVGFYKRRPTAFTRNDRRGWWDILPLVRELAIVFQRERPDEFAVLASAAEAIPKLLFPDTPFTTLTVNRNARTAVHPDDGNLKGGYGVLSAIRAGEYTGGLLVFPSFRVAVDLETCDVLIADNRMPHGNTALVGTPGEFERVSVVAYFHSSNLTPDDPAH